MTSVSCKDFEYNFYNSGWGGWSSHLRGGYAGDSKRVVVLKFETPKVSGYYEDTSFTSLSITIPYVRQSTAAKAGTLYVKLYADNPITSNSICDIPTASTCDASYSWDTDDLYVHYANFEIAKTINAGEHYYLVIGASTNFIEIGYHGYDDSYSIAYNYIIQSTSAKPRINLVDAGNNTVIISGRVGTRHTQLVAGYYVTNELRDSTLYYTTDGSNPADSRSNRITINLNALGSGESYSEQISITEACTVRAYITCQFSYGSRYAEGNIDAKYYAAPTDPDTPALDWEFGHRITVKEPWNFSWSPAFAANSDSPLKGYYVMVLKLPKGGTKYEYVRNIVMETTEGDLLGINKIVKLKTTDPGYNTNNSTNYYTRSDNTIPTCCIVDLASLGFVPGDKIKLRIKAYTRNGANQVLQGNLVDSYEYELQNAGIVRVKVGNEFKEGQVYVKVDGTWHEAQSVNTKVAGSWKESQ